MSRELLPVAILAGGLASRLGPLAARTPKALQDINGQPFIAHQLTLLRQAGVDRVVLCVGHLGEAIEEYVGTGERFGLSVDFVFDGPRLLGTGGALRNARDVLGPAFFVLYGDSYLRCDFGAIQAAFQASGKLGLMTVFRNDDRWDRSNVEFVNGVLVTYDKRVPSPRMKHIDYGLGVLHARALDVVEGDGPFDLADVYTALVAREELAGFEVHERFYEVGSPNGLEELRAALAARAPVQ